MHQLRLFSFDTNQGIGNFEQFWGYFAPDLLLWGTQGWEHSERQ